MNSLSQNTSLLNTDPSHELAFFLSLLDAPFAPFMSSLDYASMMTNASSWFYSSERPLSPLSKKRIFSSVLLPAEFSVSTSSRPAPVRSSPSLAKLLSKERNISAEIQKSLTAISTASFLFSLVSAMTAVLKRKLKKFMPTTIP